MSLQELNTTFEALFSLPILDTLHFLQIKDSNILKDHFFNMFKDYTMFFLHIKNRNRLKDQPTHPVGWPSILLNQRPRPTFLTFHHQGATRRRQAANTIGFPSPSHPRDTSTARGPRSWVASGKLTYKVVPPKL